MTSIGTQITGPAAWKGPDIDWKKEGLHVLSAEETQEIDAALAHLKSLGPLDFPEINPTNFPRDKVGQLMRSLPTQAKAGHVGWRLPLRSLKS